MKKTGKDQIPDATIIILAGEFGVPDSEDFVSKPRFLWPLGNRPAIQAMIEEIVSQGYSRIFICTNDYKSRLEEIAAKIKGADIHVICEQMPRGTAGCIRTVSDADSTGRLFAAIPAGIINCPSISDLLAAHIKSKSPLSVAVSHAKLNNISDDLVIGYVADRSIMKYIPTQGYMDIKEELIPKLVKNGKTISEIESGSTYLFRNWKEYISRHNIGIKEEGLKDFRILRRKQTRQYVYKDVSLDRSADINGDVMIDKGTKLGRETIVYGPVSIGKDCTIGNSCLVENCVIWDKSQIGDKCRLRNCLIEDGSIIKPGSTLSDTIIRSENVSRITGWISDIKTRCTEKPETFRCVVFLVFAALLVLSYWPTMTNLARIWNINDEYSSGMLVPIISVFVLWSRRAAIFGSAISSSMTGAAIFIFGQTVRFLSLIYMYVSAERASFMISLVGMIVMLFGWKVLTRMLTILLFTSLMFPWPKSLHRAIATPLQSFATSSAVFMLETIGLSVTREGNVININDISLAVAEACSGLRMITSFMVVCGMVTLVIRRCLVDKLIVLASCLPISLVCNIIRLTLTAIAFTYIDAQRWEQAFHDFGGLAMMPMALGLIYLELKFMDSLLARKRTNDNQSEEGVRNV